jgi:hypothetical protein
VLTGRVILCGDGCAEFLEALEKQLRRGSEETRLARVWRFVIAGARVGAHQESEADADGIRSADDLPREQVRIVIGLAVRLMMQVVKLADVGDAAEGHLEEGHPRDIVDVLRRKPGRGVIHRFAPGPEVVLLGGAMFGAPADRALESVRVDIDQTRQARRSASRRTSTVFGHGCSGYIRALQRRASRQRPAELNPKPEVGNRHNGF